MTAGRYTLPDERRPQTNIPMITLECRSREFQDMAIRISELKALLPNFRWYLTNADNIINQVQELLQLDQISFLIPSESHTFRTLTCIIELSERTEI